MRRTGTFGSFLLSTTFLAGVAGFSLMAPGAARADCTPAPAANGATVLCTGTDTDGFLTTFDQITVNVLDGASVSNGSIAIFLDTSPNSFINAYDSAAISTTGVSAYGALINGNTGTITLNDSAAISTTTGNNAHGAFIVGTSGTITLNDSAAISTTGNSAHGALINGNSGTITLNDSATISTTGNSAHGALINGNSGTITLNDRAAISITGGILSYGARIAGNTGTITLNGSAAINTSGYLARGVRIAGDSGFVTLNDSASINTTGGSAVGVVIIGTGNTVTLNDSAAITTTGAGAVAVAFDGSNTLVNHGTLSAANATAVLGANAGIDTVFNYGTILSGTATAINLQGGGDFLTLGTGSNITGTIDGGALSDLVTLTGTGSEDDVFLNFEDLAMDGENWSLSGTSSFVNIDVNTGRLAINGAISTTGATTVWAPGTLGGNGTLTSNVTSTGTIAPGNSVGTLNIVGTLNQTGGAFDVEFDQSGIDRTNVTGAVTLASSPAVNVIPLNGAGGASGIFLHSDTSITGAVGSVNYQGNGAATVFQTGNDLNLIAVDGTGVAATNFAALQTGLDYLGTVNGAQLDQQSDCLDNTCDFNTGKRLWARGFGRFGEEDAQDGNAGYDYRNAGTALGGDLELGSGFTLGGSLGYAATKSEVDHNAAEANIDGEFAAIYATYETGDFFVTGIASGGVQQFDLERQVASAGGTDTARADTDGFLVGGSLQAGFRLDFPGAWRLTPSAGVAYQYQSVDGYSEHGAGAGNVDVGDQDSDAIRVNAQLNVARTIAYDEFSLIPHIRLGIAGQFNNGDDVAGGFSTGDSFTLAQQDGNRVMGLAGAGLDIAFLNGVTASIDYDGQFSKDGDQNAVIAGVKLEW